MKLSFPYLDLGHGEDEDDGEDGEAEAEQEGARYVPLDAPEPEGDLGFETTASVFFVSYSFGLKNFLQQHLGWWILNGSLLRQM